ncbi:DUF2971 domain-containing protein [Neorhizobium sp. T6_25]|uniref:DUF2971 domain-containing protein n=1 Tax=Neorhizobium sp. T6_25 TaxID=2093833 RepID=UPI000CF95AE9|nr:DUF2971 domain-containing protein [Neorhizobium sp. T6_25]
MAIAGFYKEGIDKQFRDGMASALNLFEDYVNTDLVREQFLQMFGNDMLCFSLSEEFGILPMWAFYAGNHSGIVIEVSTESSWFKNKDDISKTRLHKVHYIDGVFDEILDNPQAAFGSKTTVWSYEKEWRMYCGPNDIEKTISASPDPIHLIGFPSDVVKSVIVGFRASDDVIAGVRRVVNKNYPHAGIFLAAPNNKTSAIEISPI